MSLGIDASVAPLDARRKRLRATERGLDVLQQGEAIFDELRAQWEQKVGSAQIESLETLPTSLVGPLPEHFDTSG